MTTDTTTADTIAAAAVQALADASAKASADAKTRIKAITGCEDASGREALAQYFAFDTDMAPEAAIAALKVAPKAEAGGGDAQTYEQKRLAAAALAGPGGADHTATKATIDRNAIFAARRNGTKGA
jgi:hypothetical protein